MALTTKEEATLKEVAAKEDKVKAISLIRTDAEAQIKTKLDEIKAIESKRDTDISNA